MAGLRTLEDYRGLSSATGAAISGEAHLFQSYRDILTTPKGTRRMRLSYGSMVPFLIAAPMNPGTVADVVAATAQDCREWEPRIPLRQVIVRAAEAGGMTIDLIIEHNGRVLKLEGVV